MSNKTLLAALAAASLGVAASAQAETLLFTYSEAGGINFSFDQSSTPTPLVYTPGIETTAPVTNWTGDVGPYSSIQWYSASDSGMFDTADGSYVVFGPQVYTGPESAPVFAPGVFLGADQTNGLTGTLTVTAVPEPASWALMLIGFGALGAGLRARKAALAGA